MSLLVCRVFLVIVVEVELFLLRINSSQKIRHVLTVHRRKSGEFVLRTHRFFLYFHYHTHHLYVGLGSEVKLRDVNGFT
jgi:hypothetical protein